MGIYNWYAKRPTFQEPLVGQFNVPVVVVCGAEYMVRRTSDEFWSLVIQDLGSSSKSMQVNA